MDISSQLALLECKDVIFKWGEDGRELKGKISRMHLKHGAFTAEYYDPDLEAGAGILAKVDDVEFVKDNVIIFKR